MCTHTHARIRAHICQSINPLIHSSIRTWLNVSTTYFSYENYVLANSSFTKYLLNTFHVPSPVLGLVYSTVEKTLRF